MADGAGSTLVQLSKAVEQVGQLSPEERERWRGAIANASRELMQLLEEAPPTSAPTAAKRRPSSRIVPTSDAPAAQTSDATPAQSDAKQAGRRGSNALFSALAAASKKIIREIGPGSVQTKVKAGEIDEFRHAFERVDLNSNGNLDAGELLSVMGLLGMDGCTKDEITEMVQEFDTDHDGELSFSEFLVALQQSRTGKASLAHRRMGALTSQVTLAYGKKKAYELQGNSSHLIHPKSAFHMGWDVWITLLLLVTLVVMPICLAFEGTNSALFTFNLSIDCMFLIDVVKQFNTGILDEKERVIIMDRRQIVRHYLKSWFFIDFTSSIPIDAILKLIEGGNSQGSGSELARSSKMLKMLRLLRLAKLMKLLKMSKIFEYARTVLTYFEDHYHVTISESALRLWRLMFLVLMLAHWMGCINFMICRLFGEPGPVINGVESAYLFPTDSWVYMSGLHLMPESSQYPWSLFKALCLMLQLGFESPPPMNSNCTGSPTEFLSDWCAIESWLTLICLMVRTIHPVLRPHHAPHAGCSLTHAFRSYARLCTTRCPADRQRFLRCVDRKRQHYRPHDDPFAPRVPR